ncbi:RND transporter [Spirochaetia bacterium]|nr:RND transporter [Spirochaetia bacterium]
MKLDKKTAGLFIFAALGVLLFFSKTIYTYNMPELSGTKPKRGTLSKLEISSGIAAWAETETIYAAADGAVGQVFVHEGDEVNAGQILFEMDFDLAAAERKFAETKNNIGKLEAEIGNIRSRLTGIRSALAASVAAEASVEASAENPEKSSPVLSGHAGLIALEIGKTQLVLQNARLNFELGSLSRNELINAENGLRSLFFKYEGEIEDLEFSLTAKTAELKNITLAAEAAGEILNCYRDNRIVRAPAAGIILSMAAEKGKYFPKNAPLVSIGAGSVFTVECSVSLDNNFVNPGDQCSLGNSSHILTGTVSRVKPSANGKTVSITLVSEEVSDGETFAVTFEKDSASSFTLVPNSAVNQDNDGYFLYQIKKRKGIMGDEYYLERLDIFIGDSDHRNTAVIRGITFFEPVVLTSDKILSPGITVVLKNPEDFFEN